MIRHRRSLNGSSEREQPAIQGCRVRVAELHDLDRIRALDLECFPEADANHERAAPGELEHGLSAGEIVVAEVGGVVAGFLQYENVSHEHVYILAVAVHSEFRRKGIGRVLMAHVVGEISPARLQRVSVSTVTSPQNVPMLQLLCSFGFIGRTIIHDYFGPGKPRLYCQLKQRTEYIDADDRYLIPATALQQLSDLLTQDHYVLTAVHHSTQGTMLEVSKFRAEDVSSLQSSESNSSIAFSSALLAALTFLSGFAFASARYPDSVRVLLVLAIALTTGSLLIYANASGELSRIRSEAFGAHMKWANLLSEYGGVYPLLLALPAVYAHASRNTAGSWGVSGVIVLLLGAYELSPYSLSNRYRRTGVSVAVGAAIIFLPFLSAALIVSQARQWIWLGAAILLLAVSVALRAGPDAQEANPSRSHGGWRVPQ